MEKCMAGIPPNIAKKVKALKPEIYNDDDVLDDNDKDSSDKDNDNGDDDNDSGDDDADELGMFGAVGRQWLIHAG